MRDRQETINSLRMLADYLEERPNVPVPYLGLVNAFVDPDELGVVAKAMGGFAKRHDGDYLSLTKTFGSIEFSVNVASEAVCERVVVGTEEVPEKVTPAHVREIVEWKCPESVLALAEPKVAS